MIPPKFEGTVNPVNGKVGKNQWKRMMTEWRMFLFGAPPELVIKFRLAIHAGCEMNLMMEQHESEKPFHFPHRSASYEKIRAPLACLDVSFLDGLFLTPLGRVSKLNSWRPKMSRAADFCFSNRAAKTIAIFPSSGGKQLPTLFW